MFSITKITTSAILASALLCTLPVVAAHRAKPGTTKAKLRTVASPSRSKTHHRASSHKSPSVATVSVHKSRTGVKVQSVVAAKPKSHGQQAIDESRTTEIQQALIREHYLSGEATGQWDQSTRDALTRYQGDNHWQTKILPDSRALIKLGLGPSQQNLLNPDSAALARPFQPVGDKSAPGGSN